MGSKATAAVSGESLRRSIHNQLTHQLELCLSSPNAGVTLELRNTNLTSFWPAVLQYCGPSKTFLRVLDLSYCRLKENTLFEICRVLEASLRTLKLAACHINDLSPTLLWPKRLEELDLARNELTRFPPTLTSLKHLRTLNLSGNRISDFDADILTLPYLSKLQLVRNPIANLPACVRLGAVADMRRYFGVDHPLITMEPGDDAHFRSSSVSSDFQARHSESDSGYESDTTSGQSVSNMTDSCIIPSGYTPFATCSDCFLCFPTNHSPPSSFPYTIGIVNDISLYPPVKPKAVLITPVVRVTPHGLTFPNGSPAILVLPHCLPLTNNPDPNLCLLPVCSNTGPHEMTTWEPLTLLEQRCQISQNHVIVPTTHFSMFAVLLLTLYPTAQTTIIPNEGGKLRTSDLPGFEVQFPPHALRDPTLVKVTVYYADEPYHTQGEEEQSPLASACVGLEPHGVVFHHPVKVSLPVLGSHNTMCGPRLTVWYAPFDPHRPDVLQWSELNSTEVLVSITPSGVVASFDLKHFSFVKLLWEYCRDTVIRIRDGAMFTYRGITNRIVSMFCQVFLTPPLQDGTCGMIMVAYKFGGPLPVISNYPLKVGESGASIQLTIGRITVTVEGQVQPQEVCKDTLVKTISFTGDDFSVQFLLKLTCKLESYKSFGQLRLSSPSAPNGTSPQQINLVAPNLGNMSPTSFPTPSSYVECCTPPWTPGNDPSMVRKRKPSLSSSEYQVKRPRKMNQGMLPSDDKFLLTIARDIADSWKEVSIELGLSNSVIESVIEGVKSSPGHMKCYHMLQEWKRRNSDGYTYANLAFALEKSGLESIAKKYCYESAFTNED